MNPSKSVVWRSGLVAVLLGVAACGVGDSAELEPSLETSEDPLACTVTQTCANGTSVTCSSSLGCTSGADNGGWVECDGVRTYCPPACTCGATRYTATRSGEGATCGAAMTQARTLLASAVTTKCPAGGCNSSDSLGECVPLGPNRTDGFRASITRTFSCKEPANCQ